MKSAVIGLCTGAAAPRRGRAHASSLAISFSMMRSLHARSRSRRSSASAPVNDRRRCPSNASSDGRIDQQAERRDWRSHIRSCPRPASRRAGARAARGSSRRQGRRGARRARAERREIGLGIEQPVDVIDPQALDLAGRRASRICAWCAWSNTGAAPCAGRPVVDVEEAPIVDVVLRDAEEGDAPVLRVDQPVELAPVAD